FAIEPPAPNTSDATSPALGWMAIRRGDTAHAPLRQATARRMLSSHGPCILRRRPWEHLTLLFLRSAADHKCEPSDLAQGAEGSERAWCGQKREAPAVIGPGLSCRGVTTILADRDDGR